MEHAPLRPVPARPAGPIDPARALREVAGRLPAISPLAGRALALVVLAEQPRAEVAASLGVSEPELGRLLAEARKELRQTLLPLGGSGWCERAEGLISDRLDGELGETDAHRLDVHLRNCPRCVEHERRLVQATDALIGGLARPAAPVPAEPPPLQEAPQAEDGGEETAPEHSPQGDARPGAAAPEEAPPVEAAPEDGASKDAAHGEGPPDEAAPPAHEIAAVPRADEAAPPAHQIAGGPSEDQIAAAAEVLVAARTRRQIATAVVWNAMIAIAILLTVATIAFTIAGILGAKL